MHQPRSNKMNPEISKQDEVYESRSSKIAYLQACISREV
jgi:hypothetical protein